MNKKKWDELSENYHEYIISPLQEGVKNPIFEEIEGVTDKKNKSVAEFGCGRFELGKMLSTNFKKVFASDFSPKMIEAAKKRNKFDNVTIDVVDMTKMNFHEEFDVAISINSILMPSFQDIEKSLKNIYNSLKNNSDFFLIAPSMESVIYDNFLILERELKTKNETAAIKSMKKISEDAKYDYSLGQYTDEDGTQKFFYLHEIVYFLEKVGFKDILIQKVEYPWRKDISDYEIFPKEKKLWDWFVKCKK